MRRLAALVVIATAAVALTACSPAAESVRSLGAAELVQTLDEPDVVLLDVRTPQEYAAGHLDGALNIDINDPTFREQIDALPTDATYVVYCRSGNRSAQAAAVMAEAGFTDVRDVDAGLQTLAEAGVPLVTS